METPAQNPATEGPAKKINIRIFGVGQAGLNLVDCVARNSKTGAGCVGVDTDPQSLNACASAEKILLETRALRGMGTGGDPDRGLAAAEENLSGLKTACANADVIFILAGLGGGAGTGIGPVLARVARESGALVLAFVTLPFDCEGNRRQRIAGEGMHALRAAADGVVCLPNQKLFKLIDDNTSVIETFRMSNDLLAEGVNGVRRLLEHKGLIELHFDDLCAVLRERRGESAFASAEAGGATRSGAVVDQLLTHPMFDGGQILAESEAVLVSVIGGPDLTMAEVNRVMARISTKCSRAQVLMGAAIDEAFRERIAVTIIASRHAESLPARAGLDEAAHADGARPAENLESQLLSRSQPARPHSRFVPPPPALPQEKVEELARQTPGSGRSRKRSTKMRQGQLPLEIVSRGRFDKSQPTIHNGEDLDVPTYIRRGVPLN